jgi:hypothetical protein
MAAAKTKSKADFEAETKAKVEIRDRNATFAFFKPRFFDWGLIIYYILEKSLFCLFWAFFAFFFVSLGYLRLWLACMTCCFDDAL